ncbi:hypothetical protein T439DRAFT_70308 [Meredithblackwellia eburnea MCA 4105]
MRTVFLRGLLLTALLVISHAQAEPLSALSQFQVEVCGIVPFYFSGGVQPYTLSVIETGLRYNTTGYPTHRYDYASAAPAGSTVFFRVEDASGAIAEPGGTFVQGNNSYVSGIPMTPKTCLNGSTSSAHPAVTSIHGTHMVNISSSNPSFFQTVSGSWNSDDTPGYFEVYSNSSDAKASFTFTGVGLTFYGARKVDRNEYYLSIDGGAPFVIYPGTGGLGSTTDNTWPTETLWVSPLLEEGTHRATIEQIAGYSTWLVAQEWGIAVLDGSDDSTTPGSYTPPTSTYSTPPLVVGAASITPTSTSSIMRGSASGSLGQSTAAVTATQRSSAGCGKGALWSLAIVAIGMGLM